MTVLRAMLFGQPRFEIDGSPVRLTARPKVLPLLAYVLLHRDRPVSRDTLAFLLWEDESEEVARTNLRRHIYHLTGALPEAGPPWLLVDSDALQWNPNAPLWLDVAEFERLVTTPEGRSRAVELYTGDLLQNQYDEWVFAPRQRLQDLYVAALAELLIEARGRRDRDSARTYAQRILVVDPWREDVLRQLMSVRYECGDRSGALAEFEEFERRLHDELGADAMLETVALRDAIVRNAPLPVATQPFIGEQEASAVRLLPFAGRENELARLRTAWGRTVRGHGTLLAISGEAGIGKTRLASEFALVAEREGGRVLWGATTSPESIPYQPVAEALRAGLGLIAAQDTEPIWLAALAQLLPELAERRPGLPSLPRLDPDRERGRLFEALVRSVGGLARARPIVIVLEDLHWGGAATVALIETIVRRLAERGVLVLVTFRDDEIEVRHPLITMRKRLMEDERAISVSLGRLDATSVSSIVSRVPEISAQSEALAEQLYAASEGNALFLSELIRDVAESTHRVEGGQLPSGLHATIAARIARLSGDARSLLDMGAVAGTAFDVETIRYASGWDGARMDRAADELVERHLLREAGRRGGFDLTFAHYLIRMSIYGDVPAAVRRRWHHRIARVTEERFADRSDHAAIIAGHYEAAGEGERAASYYLRAARAALEMFANDEASTYARRGLELVPDCSELRYELLATQESSESRRGDRVSQARVLDALEQTAGTLGNRVLSCDVLQRRIDYYRLIAQRDREAATIARLRWEAEELHDPRFIAVALEAEATYRVNLGMREDARASISRAIELYDSAGDERGLVFALTMQAHIETYRGDQAAAERCIARAKRIAHDRNDPGLIMRVLMVEGHIYFYKEEWPAYREVAAQALRVARSIGDRDGEANVSSAIATAYMNLGEIAEARRHFAHAIEIQREIQRLRGLGTTLVNAAVLELEAGRGDEAERLIYELEGIARTIEWPQGFGYCAIKRFELAQLRGDFASAMVAANEALESARELKSPRDEGKALHSLGLAYTGLHDYPHAIECLRQTLEIFGRVAASEETTETLADLAIAYLGAGDTEAACECAETVRAEIKGLRSFVAIHATWAVAQALRARGDLAASDEYRLQAYALVQARTSAYPDPDSQTAFRRIAENAAIIAASEPLARAPQR